MEGSVEGNLVDVINGKIFPAKVHFSEGKVTAIDKVETAPDRYILPGFIDAHIHIESSQLCPSRFAEIAVVHGTTGVVCDPHEIANVLGVDGIRYMLEDARGVPLRFNFTAPSCVPSTDFETSGAILGAEEIDKLMRLKEFVGLAEVMNVQAVLRKDPDIIAKIKAAKFYWKQVDGHCPGLTGKALADYIGAGISNDHECTTADEAEEKFQMGMWIMVREGSGHKNLRDLLPFAKANECLLVTDDLQAVDLAEGHLNVLLRKAVKMGMDPIHAIRAVTAWPAWHYFLPTGVIGIGKPADLVIIEDIRDFKVLEVYIGGELVAKDGKPLFEAMPKELAAGTIERDIPAAELGIHHEGKEAKVRVIVADPDQIETSEAVEKLKVDGGVIISDPVKDVLLMAVVNRYRDAPPALGFIKGFKLKRGAIASTVAHDSHNIIAIGVDRESMSKAIAKVSNAGGYCVTDGTEEASLVLNIAGLMSTKPHEIVIEDEKRAIELSRKFGCDLPAPFTTLSFLSLLVVPSLRLSDKGLFDSRSFKFVDPVIE